MNCGIPKWQKRRAEFNHDWLKNVYLIRMDEFLNLLDDKIEDSDLERRFVPEVLKSWEDHASEAGSLTRDFEAHMSPRTFFDCLPLSRCDYSRKEWLGELIHQLWLARYPVKEWIENASMCAKDVERAYKKLQEELDGCKDIESAVALRPFRQSFAEFRNRCQALATSLEPFHNEVKVT
jgi:hypothetical protein